MYALVQGENKAGALNAEESSVNANCSIPSRDCQHSIVGDLVYPGLADSTVGLRRHSMELLTNVQSATGDGGHRAQPCGHIVRHFGGGDIPC